MRTSRCPDNGCAHIGWSPDVWFSRGSVQDQVTSGFYSDRQAWQLPGLVTTLAATPSDSPTTPNPAEVPLPTKAAHTVPSLTDSRDAQLHRTASGRQEEKVGKGLAQIPENQDLSDSSSPQLHSVDLALPLNSFLFPWGPGLCSSSCSRHRTLSKSFVRTRALLLRD